MRALFATFAGAGMLVAVAVPTVPILWPLAIGAALVTTGVARFVLWPYIEGRSGVDALVTAGLHPNRQADRDARIIATASRAQVQL